MGFRLGIGVWGLVNLIWATVLLLIFLGMCPGTSGSGGNPSAADAAATLMERASASDNNLIPIPIQTKENQNPLHKLQKRYLDPTLLKFWIQVGECPESPDGAKQYYCPSLTPSGKQVCIDDYQLCNGVKECPNAEDENKHYCLFYKALKSQVELLERSMATLNAEATIRSSPSRRYSSSGSYYGGYGYDYK